MELINLIKAYKNIELSKLKLWAKNPKVEMPERIEVLKSKLQRGVVKPLFIDGRDESTIIDGNQRYKGLIQLGVTEFPCLIININNNKQMLDVALQIETTDVPLDQDKVVELYKDSGIKLEEFYVSLDEIKLSELSTRDNIDFDNIEGNEDRVSPDKKQEITC